jgi:hypothetical protein
MYLYKSATIPGVILIKVHHQGWWGDLLLLLQL